MDIVGNGFLARHLAPLVGAHEGAVVFAAGVSAAAHTQPEGFDREARLLYDVIRRCGATGERLVYFSTAAAGMYAVPGAPPAREDGPVYPATVYGRHKLAMEAVLAASGVDHLVLRLSHVVGPGQARHQLLPALVAQVRTGAVRVFRGADRDLIDVADVVAVVGHLLATGVNREVVNVASGFPVPVERIVEGVQARLGLRATWAYEPGTRGQPVCTAKLRALVPAASGMAFGPRYFEAVLDKYVGAYAEAV
ncbi:NAD-dependent epimerase/dehydratase family protein [Saccharothrix australiensis]|uniref:Nucleoside-diphosphate-sugar epimerase n=1 Tax=Saccharothrix australiensis TaxID=2072 RepID=A0A495W3L3_9PSEU|nr:NAD-dependent epimerase/dehydratase family protein [Saccharothrix australiensis]RKT55637.1 nucleoside-diphosphate-sugar epimerase [Saccharothrix australiensis]